VTEIAICSAKPGDEPWMREALLEADQAQPAAVVIVAEKFPPAAAAVALVGLIE